MKLLEAMPATGVTLAAADAVRAVAMNNNENKTAVRENWGIPLLVKLLTEDVRGPPLLPDCTPLCGCMFCACAGGSCMSDLQLQVSVQCLAIL